MSPLIWLRLPGTRDIRYFQTKLLFTSTCPLLITFATKLYLRSETYRWRGALADLFRRTCSASRPLHVSAKISELKGYIRKILLRTNVSCINPRKVLMQWSLTWAQSNPSVSTGSRFRGSTKVIWIMTKSVVASPQAHHGRLCIPFIFLCHIGQ